MMQRRVGNRVNAMRTQGVNVLINAPEVLVPDARIIPADMVRQIEEAEEQPVVEVREPDHNAEEIAMDYVLRTTLRKFSLQPR